MEQKQCEQCKEPFSGRNRTRFCGWRCYRQFVHADPTMWSECPTCKSRFRQRFRTLPRKFCSSKCVRKIGPLIGRRLDGLTICEGCGLEFRHRGYQSRRFCGSACHHASQTGVARSAAGLKVVTKQAHRAAIGKCERCGWSLEVRVLHVHHIDHDHRNDEPSNWEVLCPTCHKHHHFTDKRQSNYRTPR
jgi:hypothetical protein